MKLFIQRRDGEIRVLQEVNKTIPSRRDPFTVMRTFKTVKDTPTNFADILRWADVVGHTIEEL